MADRTGPEPQKTDPTRPRSKIFDPNPSLVNLNDEKLKSTKKSLLFQFSLEGFELVSN